MQPQVSWHARGWLHPMSNQRDTSTSAPPVKRWRYATGQHPAAAPTQVESAGRAGRAAAHAKPPQRLQQGAQHPRRPRQWPVFSLVRTAARAAGRLGSRRKPARATPDKAQAAPGQPTSEPAPAGPECPRAVALALTPTGVCAHDTARPFDGGADADGGDDGRADRPGARVRAAPQLLSRHARCLPGPLADDSIGSAFFLLCC